MRTSLNSSKKNSKCFPKQRLRQRFWALRVQKSAIDALPPGRNRATETPRQEKSEGGPPLGRRLGTPW